MTYLKHTSRRGQSTLLISARIQLHSIEYVEKMNFVLNRFVNQALFTFVHDLQTEHNITKETYWLTYSGGRFVGYEEDTRGSVPRMLRIRVDIIEYLRQNNYKVNTAINLAIDRWRRYEQNGSVAGYIISKLIDRKKESVKEKVKSKQEEPPKNWVICGNCHYWQPRNRQTDGVARCNHPKMKGATYRAAFCDHFAAHLENNQTTTK